MYCEAVCCELCIKKETIQCPVKMAEPWSKWADWCSEFLNQQGQNAVMVIAKTTEHVSGVYVVVAENDKPVKIAGKEFIDDGGPLVFEQYTRSADLESIKARKRTMEKRYGKCRIARLVFIEENENPQTKG